MGDYTEQRYPTEQSRDIRKLLPRTFLKERGDNRTMGDYTEQRYPTAQSQDIRKLLPSFSRKAGYQ